MHKLKIVNITISKYSSAFSMTTGNWQVILKKFIAILKKLMLSINNFQYEGLNSIVINYIPFEL